LHFSLFIFLLFFHRLADRDLWNSHEARAAMDAQTILDDGAWGLPHLFDGRVELQKPPLYYWLTAGIAWLRVGVVDALAVRMPAALAASGCVLVVLLLTWRCGRVRAGVLAALILATAVHFTWLARVGRIDMLLTLTVTMAVGALYFADKGNRQQATGKQAQPCCLLPVACCLLSYLAMAAGVMLKGPIGVVLPAVILGAHLLIEGRLPIPWHLRAWVRLAHELGLWWGLPLVLALTLPWFLWANAATQGELFRVFFWYHNIERGFGSDVLRAHEWWFYGPRFAIDFLPWTPILVFGLVVVRRHWRRDPELRFGLVWLVSVLLLLSCFRYKRGDYLLPAYPGAALFLGCVLSSWKNRPLAGVAVMAGTVALVWTVYVTWVLPSWEPAREYQRFAAVVRSQAPAPTPILFFRTEAHPLAFHVGRPLTILVRWEELQERLAYPGDHYLIMPEALVAEWPQHLDGIRLEVITRNTELADGYHEHPLVLLCGHSTAESPTVRTEP
jgi:4-amino-4-deoxy-L-arabinose transferase-like glycosyltransferase